MQFMARYDIGLVCDVLESCVTLSGLEEFELETPVGNKIQLFDDQPPRIVVFTNIMIAFVSSVRSCASI